MQRADVIIVGGGPGGSSCAGRLKRLGAEVIVVDRRTFPRDKICAGWVTPEVWTALAVDLDEYGRSRTLQPITGFRTGVIGGDEVFTDYGHPVSYGIRRCEFDHYLLERAGVTCRLGESLQDLQNAGGNWILNSTLSAPLLVGAGGHFCPVARQLGGRETSTAPVVAAQEIEFPIPSGQASLVSVEPEVPELYFCRDLAGYGWCFRKGDYLNIGLGRVDRQRVSEHVSDFVQFLKDRGKVGCDVPGKFHGHAYGLYEGRPPRLSGDNWLLIGDAAGLAYPQSGEGIRPAVESGLLAAEVLHQRLADPQAPLADYDRRLRERLGKPRTGGPVRWLPASWLHALAARLLATRWFNRKVVLDKWFLHADQPALDVGV